MHFSVFTNLQEGTATPGHLQGRKWREHIILIDALEH